MLIKKGILPKGIEIDGQVYREYTLREQVVADEIEVMESEDGPRAAKSDGFYNVCILSRRLTFVGLPPEAVTPAVLMGMRASDFSELLNADKEMVGDRAGFRDAAEAAPDAAPGTPETGV